MLPTLIQKLEFRVLGDDSFQNRISIWCVYLLANVNKTVIAPSSTGKYCIWWISLFHAKIHMNITLLRTSAFTREFMLQKETHHTQCQCKHVFDYKSTVFTTGARRQDPIWYPMSWYRPPIYFRLFSYFWYISLGKYMGILTNRFSDTSGSTDVYIGRR